MNRTRAMAACGLAAWMVTCAAAGDEPTLQQRLDRLVERLEQSRQEMHIPGMALAVVKDDEVVLLRGFGVTDLESQAPVTPDTLFAVGSTTKSFTAALIGMLVDEGRMDWDDPVRRHLPDYVLQDETANENVVVRDLLCHRIGLATMTILWMGTDASQREVYETSLKAELLNPFRKKWGYSNVSYLAAGLAAGTATESDWDTLIATRFFEPLGMADSCTSYAAAKAHPSLSSGYIWKKEKSAHERQELRDIDNIAPAGSIYSSARDMAQWVRMQLGRGTFEGRELLSGAQHEQTWTRHTEVGGGVHYGLGWFLREWNGRRVVDHAGGIDGFTAEVALLPDEKLGFVLLMNLFGAPLAETSRGLVFDALVGEWTEDAAPAAMEDFTPYLGSYTANFGPFKDATFEVLVQNGRLAVDVPGQMVYELLPPDDDGRRTFAITDQIVVKFNRDDAGEVYSMFLYQAGFTFELLRKGCQYPLEIDLAAVQPYLGRYHSTVLKRDVTVLLRENRLAVDVPDQTAYELFPPDDQGRWVFRVKDDLWVRFERDGDGAVTAMTLSQGGVEEEMARVAEDESTALPDVGELMERVVRASGAERLTELKSLRARGSVRFPHMGMEGDITLIAAGERYRETIDLGRFGRVDVSYAPGAGVYRTAITGRQEADDDIRAYLRQLHPFTWARDWRESFEQVLVSGREARDGVDVYVVRLRSGDLPPITAYVGVEDGLVRAFDTIMPSALGTRIPITKRVEEFAEVQGVKLPKRYTERNDFSGATVVEFERFEPNVELHDADFDIPE